MIYILADITANVHNLSYTTFGQTRNYNNLYNKCLKLVAWLRILLHYLTTIVNVTSIFDLNLFVIYNIYFLKNIFD